MFQLSPPRAPNSDKREVELVPGLVERGAEYARPALALFVRCCFGSSGRWRPVSVFVSFALVQERQ